LTQYGNIDIIRVCVGNYKGTPVL